MHLVAESYLHRLDPFAIRITEGFGVRWYGLSYAAGFVIAWLIVWWFARTRRSGLSTRSAGDLMTYVIIGVLVGGRLGYALFYDRHLLFGFSSSFPYWDLLAINKGGMASHGGILGVILACCLFGARHGVSKLHLLDIGTVGCAPGLCLGRLANFVNGELWGKPLPDDAQTYLPGQEGVDPPWWSVKYPTEVTEQWVRAAADPSRYPEAVVESATRRLAEVDALRTVIEPGPTFYDDVVAAAYAGAEPVIAHLRPLLTAYYPSQLLQALTDGPLLLGVLLLVWLKPRKPGVVGCWFLMAYGGLRILSEVYRQPDEGVALLLGLSRGQVLSVLMIAVGVVALPICARRQVAPVGGMVRRTQETKRLRDEETAR